MLTYKKQKAMEMPVPCDKCHEWVELNSTRESELDKTKMLCPNCFATDSLVHDKVEEIKDIQYMLDNNDSEVKGDRRGWKRNIKELKQEITKLGYNYEDHE